MFGANVEVKKVTVFLITVVTLCYSNFIFSSGIEIPDSEPNWTGFYVGGNAGYWGSQDNVATTGSVSFINQTYEPGASNIANALAQLADNNASLHSDGFIGGAQVGYNYEFSKGILLGLDTDFDGLTNSNNSFTLQKTVNLANYDENYDGSLTVAQNINDLGTVRARLGYLWYPTFLVYATGGFAYGNVTLDTDWAAQESLGPAVFPAIATQNNVNKTLPGWTAGGGIEWLFKPQWSVMLESSYYSLNTLNVPATLAQINKAVSPPALWGSAAANTALSPALWTIKVGISYHFL